ncbi:MAG TPA: FAD-binding oxidoreductase, partial [Trebonia sp.]
HAVLKWEADAKLLADAGAEAEHLETGCCGLAGNFGFESGHGEVSRACAERALLPRLRDASLGAVILADGFSCRTQIHELDSGGREAMHLAELLANMGNLPYARPEEKAAPRPAEPSAGAKAAALAVTAAGVAGVIGVAGAAAAALWKTIRRH